MSDPKKRTSKAPAWIAACLALALGVSEGREHWAYYDQAGILTVCGGITGPGVVKGKFYSWAECDKLEVAYIERMNAGIGKCIGNGGLNPKEWIAWGHFTYNVGTPTFCKSTAAKYLRAGKYAQACAQMAKWTYITKPGRGPVNCRIKAEKCSGIPKRRDLEMKWCLDAQTDGSWLG